MNLNLPKNDVFKNSKHGVHAPQKRSFVFLNTILVREIFPWNPLNFFFFREQIRGLRVRPCKCADVGSLRPHSAELATLQIGWFLWIWCNEMFNYKGGVFHPMPHLSHFIRRLRQFRQQQKCIGGSPTHANSGSNKGTEFHRCPDSGQQAVKVGVFLPFYCILISFLPHLHFTLRVSCFATPFQNHQKALYLPCMPSVSW